MQRCDRLGGCGILNQHLAGLHAPGEPALEQGPAHFAGSGEEQRAGQFERHKFTG